MHFGAEAFIVKHCSFSLSLLPYLCVAAQHEFFIPVLPIMMAANAQGERG
jgi:hypothetical protein